jgi:hypothetical protein
MGMRASEVTDRLVRDIDDDGRVLIIPHAKTRAGVRRLRIPEVLQPLLAALATAKEQNERLFGADANRYWLRLAVRRICRIAKTPIIGPHGLRGTHATLAVQAGVTGDAVAAGRVAARIGLINTMVFTHIPSNVLLILVPLMPNLHLAILVLLLRFSISQMDVPTRQSYIMAVVSPEERSAAAGITGVARTTGAAISPLFVGVMFARPALVNLPFFIAGTLKIAYDLLLYRQFVAVQPPEEVRR